MDFVNAVLETYPSRLCYPSGQDLHRIIKGFEAKWQLPNCAGAIDCSHICIKTPHIASYRDYVDRSGKKSVVLQAVVDSQGRFLDVFSGWPGSVHDTRIFNHSPLGRALRQKEFLQEPLVSLGGHQIRPYLIGDAGYKLEDFMIVPYPGQNLDPNKFKFNKWHSSSRMCVEMAFGRLKGRFRWLNGELFVRNPEDFAPIISTACILHNIMMDQNDVYDVDWVDGVYLRRSAAHLSLIGRPNLSGSQVRDLVCKHVVNANR